jgi:U3 small nucleolar RNA-associated protein 20
MDNFVETSPEEVLYILVHLFKRATDGITPHGIDGSHLDREKKVYKFCDSKVRFCSELVDNIVKTGDHSSNQVDVKEAAILWGSIRCYSNVKDASQDSLTMLNKLICSLDQVLEVEEGDCT